MEFLKERIQVICDELKRLSIEDQKRIDNWDYKEGEFVTPQEADKKAYKRFDASKMHWYGPDRHYWFKRELTLGKEDDPSNYWIHISTQIDEWDDGKNPQFLFFLDGEPIQGLDMNHREINLSGLLKKNKTHRIDIQAYTGTLHDEFTLDIKSFKRNEKINALYYDIQTPLYAFSRLKEEDPDRLELTKALNDTINLLDLRDPYSKEFYESVDKASEFIQSEVYTRLAGRNDVIASCIGHTHIDVAWWWTVAQTRQKVCRSFATVLKLMDEYPDYKFMSSQPVLYYFLKKRYPSLYEKIKKRIKEKRWEPEGGMWVEADCNLTSGESLVRQFLYGKQFFKNEFGVDNRILWLPDVFGYSGALPQIMKKCGIDYFQTTKIAWNQYNKFPYDTMMWRGIDGTEIFTHMCTTTGIGQDPYSNYFTTYNGMLHPDSLIGGWQRYQQKNLNNDILVSYGYGDGGGGPTRDMLEIDKRMSKGVAGMPKTRQVFAGDYFDELHEKLKDNKELPVWEGELYFEYHRGTYTSIAKNKRNNRKSELMMADLELFATLLALEGQNYPYEQFLEMWRTIMVNQFHDILPGSSIKEVYEVTDKEYAALKKEGEKLESKYLKKLTGRGSAITVYNTLGFERSDVAILPDTDAKTIVGAGGVKHPIQTTADGRKIAFLEKIPSKGSYGFATEDKDMKASNLLKVSKGGIETPFYSIKIDKQGLFTSIYDKEAEREVLKEGQKGNLIKLFEDKPIYFDDWNIDRFYTEKSWDITDVQKMEWIEKGPVRATLLIERKFTKCLLQQKIHFYADMRRIDFETYVDYHLHQHLLKVFFPTDIHSDEAVFQIQFGNIKRKITKNTSWETARFESCGQKWMDFSEGHYGVALMNDCKYGYSVEDGNISLTLIKAGIEPNPDCDNEEHFFTYSLYPHLEDYKDACVEQEACKINQDLIAVGGGKLKKSFSFVKADKRNVNIESIKMAEDGKGFIIRCFEFENARTKFTLELPNTDIKSVCECNCVEEKVKDIVADAHSFEDVIKPYEIKTYRVITK